MPPRKQPATISSQAFNGSDELDWEDLEAVRVCDAKDAAAKLVQEWSGGCVGMVNLTLSSDARKVEDAGFFLLGSLFEAQPRVFSTEKFWPGSRAKLVLKEIDAELFKFSNSLVSALVDSSQLDWAFKTTNKGPDLSDAEAKDRNLGPFSLRCHIIPTTDSSAQAYLVLFPLSVKDLTETYPLATDPRFPSLELCGPVDISLAPLQREILDDRSWGQPLLPAIIRQDPFDENSAVPPTTLLKKSTALLLLSAVKADTKKSFNFLSPLWEKSVEQGRDALKLLQLPVQWPAPVAISPQQGRCPLFICIFVFLFKVLFPSVIVRILIKGGGMKSF